MSCGAGQKERSFVVATAAQHGGAACGEPALETAACAQLCCDADGDGVCDSADSCPSDAENDRDSDVVCGDVDSCKYDAENDRDSDLICATRTRANTMLRTTVTRT